MKYAIIKNGGHQYKVTEGQVLEVEKLESDGTSYVFEEVLLVVDGDNVAVGAPTVEGMKVYADIVAEVKGDKIEVFKYKSKSRYRKHTGHRQKYTQVKVSSIGTKPKADVIPSKVEGSKVKKAPASAQGRSASGGKKVAKPVTSKPKGRSVKKATKK